MCPLDWYGRSAVDSRLVCSTLAVRKTHNFSQTPRGSPSHSIRIKAFFPSVRPSLAGVMKQRGSVMWMWPRTTFRVLHGSAPPYLGPLVPVRSLPGSRSLRSPGTNRLLVPPVKRSTVLSRSSRPLNEVKGGNVTFIIPKCNIQCIQNR